MSEITMVAAAVLLLLVGAGAGFLLGRRGRSDANSKLEETRAEFDDYRKDVTRHFDQTARQFQSIGQQYRELYEHMARGAETFCVPGEPGSALPFSTQSRLPTDADETGVGSDGPVSAAVDEQPRAHIVDEKGPEAHTVAESTTDDPIVAAAVVDAIEEDAGSTEGSDAHVDLIAEASSDEVDDAAEAETGTESATDQKPEESDRIYH